MSKPKNNPRKGLHLHRILPILFSGSPTDPKNITFITRQQHAEVVVFWNNKAKEVKDQ